MNIDMLEVLETTTKGAYQALEQYASFFQLSPTRACSWSRVKAQAAGRTMTLA
jgi:hypothetical protein